MRSILSRFRAFARDRRGVAAVEFALVLPVLITLYFGTVEAADLYTVDRRVSTVASTIGDLVSRIDGTIDEDTTLADYFKAANSIILPYSTTGLTQVVSVISVTAAGVATVVWSRGYNGGTARANNSSYPLAATTQINQLARGGWLVVAEVAYAHKPLYGLVVSSTINIKRVEYFLPRYDEIINIG
jgi:Flp pilus assembly protein TadG